MSGRRRDLTFGFTSDQDRAYAVNIVETVTWLAGHSDYFDELGQGRKNLDLFGSNGRARSSKVFEWLMAALSYQGISDAVARSYMAAHEGPGLGQDRSRRREQRLSPTGIVLAFSWVRLS